jgi:murein DD-endopeptidase MepM/ murein hydrolase activator NlpD
MIVTVARLACLALLAASVSQPAPARRNTRRAPSRPASQPVDATPEIEARVTSEVAKARQILHDLSTDNLLESPYLVSALYYHDGFLSDFPVDRSTASPERRIVGQISNELSAERKARFVRLLHEIWEHAETGAATKSAAPVAYSRCCGRHKYAVDLFAPEGAPAQAVSRGIVVLADHDWRPDDLFSTTSRKGGNAVILFDPDHDRFYRYCHLSTVEVQPGAVVAAGQTIGRVGHSGLNASMPGHGRHLHFEANAYRDGHVSAFDGRQLRALLRQWRSSSK